MSNDQAPGDGRGLHPTHFDASCVFYVNRPLEENGARTPYDNSITEYISNKELEATLRTNSGLANLDWFEGTMNKNVHPCKQTPTVKIIGLDSLAGKSFLKSSSIVKYSSCTNKWFAYKASNNLIGMKTKFQHIENYANWLAANEYKSTDEYVRCAFEWEMTRENIEKGDEFYLRKYDLLRKRMALYKRRYHPTKAPIITRAAMEKLSHKEFLTVTLLCNLGLRIASACDLRRNDTKRCAFGVQVSVYQDKVLGCARRKFYVKCGCLPQTSLFCLQHNPELLDCIPINPSTVQSALQKCGITWHSFRRTAMLLVKVAGARISRFPPSTVRRQFGWSPKSSMPQDYSGDWRRFNLEALPILPGLIRSALNICATTHVMTKSNERVA